MKIKKKTGALLLALVMASTLLAGCAGRDAASTINEYPSTLSKNPGHILPPPAVYSAESSEEMDGRGVPEPDAIDAIDMPEAEASGVLTQNNSKVVLDYSNTADGYVMVSYLGSNHKVKVGVTGPSGVTYYYNLTLTGEYDVLPLSDGSGSYTVGVYENISGTSYSTAFYHTLRVELKDEFAPFLRSNKYVSYTKESRVVNIAAELAEGKTQTTDIIKAVYNYVIKNLSYDYDLAATVESGYIPDLDADLDSGKGICFDYAALMTAMLRSRGVPTKLVFGYTGDLYHAWINTYSEESGWIEATIYFDGKQWKLMDPTFASNAKGRADVIAYINNSANYTAKYIY